MKVEAYYPQRLFISLVIPLCVLSLGPAMGSLMDCRAQSQESPRRSSGKSTDDTPMTGGITDVKEDYRISPSDVIEVQVDRAPELSGMRRVTASGKIRVEYLGLITAEGKTPDELAGFIADSLRGRYLKNPRVTVTIAQMNSHTFFIQGSVRRPGAYQLEGRPTLLTLVTLAGGLADNHGSTAFIISETRHPDSKATDSSQANAPPILQSKSDAASQPSQTPSQSGARDQAPEERDEYELIKVNINGLLKGDLDKNIRLEPRSVVNIPQAEVFFVGGDVNAPGSFVFKEGATLRQAITLAQGMKATAAPDQAIIFREDPGGKKKQEIRIDARKIMNGKQEDVAMEANDIVIIPNSRSKAVGGALLATFGFSPWRVLGF